MAILTQNPTSDLRRSGFVVRTPVYEDRKNSCCPDCANVEGRETYECWYRDISSNLAYSSSINIVQLYIHCTRTKIKKVHYKRTIEY